METNTFMDNLTELRSRLIKCSIAVVFCFVCLIYFSKEIYLTLAEPLQAFLPSSSSMIATEVASPFLTPLKLTFFVSLLVSMPYSLNQIWKFIAPGLYDHEKSAIMPYLVVTPILFFFRWSFSLLSSYAISD